MPKNSRPDIQVLEDRIVRLKSQLLEYKDLRLYGVTKRRLSAVSSELEECITIIHDIVTADSNNISESSLSAFTDYPGEGPSEFASSGDLLDAFLFNTPNKDNSDSSHHSSRDIVKTYSQRIQECAETVGYSSGIIQVNQFCQLLNTWYQGRFSITGRNTNFYFKATRIHEWIDLLMLAAGHAMHNGLFPAFISDVSTWVKDLEKSNDSNWVLPYSVMRMKQGDAECVTQEAVLLELILKPTLYDESFYPGERHTVAEIVIESGKFTDADLSIDAIIQNCPKLVVTSSFDSSKYLEG